MLTKLLRLTFFALFFCLTAAALQAQDNKEYKQLAADMEQNIWGSKDPIFESNVLPAEYKNESAVILAKKYALETETKRKGDYSRTEGFRKVTTGVLLETIREKIYINDKVSLQEFSEMGFNKLQNKQIGFWGQTKKASYTFLGIRVIKPDGNIQKINLDEAAVTLKESTDEKKNKIAIPNLNIGDIIDYYIVSYDKANFTNSSQAMAFVMEAEYATLNYSISLSLDKNIAVEYQLINGAPDFKIGKDGDDNLLQLTVSKLPKTKDQIWISTKRQIPAIRMLYTFGDSYYSKTTKVKKGEVGKMVNMAADVQKNYTDILTRFITYDNNFNKDWNKYKKKHKEELSDSAIASYIYYYGQYETYFNYSNLWTNFTPEQIDEQLLKNPLHMASTFSQRIVRLYSTAKLNVELIVFPGRNNVKNEALFFVNDLNSMLKIYTPKPMYWHFTDQYAFGEFDPSFEGEAALAASLKGMKIVSESKTKIETTSASQNNWSEKLTIDFDKANPQLTNIRRNVIAKGHSKKEVHKSLVSRYDKEVFLLKQLDMDNPPKEAKINTKEKHLTELTKKFQAKPTELKNYTISNFGFHHSNPVFEMEQEFTMDALVKKAGNNFIVEVGKLIGDQLEIKPEQRERKIDVYMPYARSYNNTIELAIPQGYEFEGIENLNKKVDNETGGFVSNAKVENGKLIITTYKYYNNFFEKAENWNKLTSFIDAAFEFGKEKLLLKRK